MVGLYEPSNTALPMVKASAPAAAIASIRARELIFTSEGLRHIPEIWERIWGLDMPDVATPYRTHGGVI